MGGIVVCNGWSSTGHGQGGTTVATGFPAAVIHGDGDNIMCGWARTDASSTMEYLAVTREGALIIGNPTNESGFMYSICYEAQ